MKFTARLKLYLAAAITTVAFNTGELYAQGETVFYSNIVPSVITTGPVYSVE